MDTPAKYITRSIQVGALESEKKIPFTKMTRNVADPHFVAAENLADAIANVCNELDALGYDVISILPTIRGESKATSHSGYGYSVTDGVVITGKLVGDI